MSLEVSTLTNLEKLLRETEFENSKLISKIGEEKQIIADLDSQITAQNNAVTKLEKAITKLQDQTANLNDQCKINKDVSLSFKNSSYLVDGHIEEMKKKLEEIVFSSEKEKEVQQELLSNYSSKWFVYKEKWESQTLATKVKEIKNKADNLEIDLQEKRKQIQEMTSRIDAENAKKECKKAARKKLIEIITGIASIKTKTNCTLLRLNEDQRKLEVLKARENEMKLKFIKEKAVKTFASPCQENEELPTTCQGTSRESRQKQLPQSEEDGAFKIDLISKSSSEVDSTSTKHNMPNKPGNKTSVLQRFMQIKVPSIPGPPRTHDNPTSKEQDGNFQKQTSHSTRNLEASSFQWPSRAPQSISSESNQSFYQMPLILPQIEMQHSFKGMDGQKTQTLPSMPSLPSLPPMPKEEKEPRPYLKSDRSLMKAPSKGSPGSRKNKTPFERKNSNNNKALAQNYVTPVQGNMTPEKGKLSPMQTDVMKNMQARSLSEHIERAEGIYQRGNAAKDKNDAPFLIVSSSYDNFDKDSSSNPKTQEVTPVYAAAQSFNSPGFHLSIDQHEQNMKNFTKSPGDGFYMESRPMFQQTSEGNEQNVNENADGSEYGGFFSSTSFINAGSLFTFASSNSPAQVFNESDYQITSDNNAWQGTNPEPSFHQEASNEFSFLGASSAANQPPHDLSLGGFLFGGATTQVDDIKNTGFNLF